MCQPGRPAHRVLGDVYGGFIGLGRLPQHKVAGLFPVVFVVQAAEVAVAQLFGLDARQLAVIGKAGNIEVHIPLHFVGVALVE